MSEGKWLGRRRDGDTNSWKAFLAKTPRKVLEDHLRRHHRGYKP